MLTPLFPFHDGLEFAQFCARSRFLTHSGGSAAVKSTLVAEEGLWLE